jgi:hypothetical protein
MQVHFEEKEFKIIDVFWVSKIVLISDRNICFTKSLILKTRFESNPNPAVSKTWVH